MKKYIITIGIFLILLLGFQQYLIWKSPPKTEDVLLKKITELELKIDSLNIRKDSIRTVIDSTHIKIITNEKHYQERINTIMLQSDSNNLIFFFFFLNNYDNN